MHGPEAALCSGPDEDSAHVVVVCAKEIKEQSKKRVSRLGHEPTTSLIEEQSADHCNAATCWCKKRACVNLNRIKGQAFFFEDHRGTG